MVHQRSLLVQRVEQAHPYVCGGFVGSIIVAHLMGYNNLSSQFSSLQYPLPSEGKEQTYGRGLGDAFFVIFMMAAVALFRSIYRATVLRATAQYLHLSRSTTSKWLDSGWVGLYFVFSFTSAIIIFKNDEWFLNTKYFWIGYPHAMNYDFKRYYLTQLAFWLTNLGVFFIEAQRRDYWQFLGHHVVTIGLVASSYYYQFHRIGAAILMLLDVGDVFYYHVKMLKYARAEKSATIGFGVFMTVWFLTRHVLYGFVLYSVWFEFPKYLGLGYTTESGLLLTKNLWFAFSFGLLALQGLLLFWFVMIVRLAIRVLRGGSAEDETDADDEEEDKDVEVETKPCDPEQFIPSDSECDSQGNLLSKDGADMREASPKEDKKMK